MARIIRSPEAQADVDEIALYIAQDNLDAALRWLETMDEKFRLLSSFPGAGPARDAIAPGLRSYPVGNYLILYRAAPGRVEIVRVVHGARNLRRLFTKGGRRK
jgi:toxin ParE1/3/4